MQIGAVADMVRLSGELSDKELDDKAATIVGGISKYLTNTTWLSGPTAWLMALADPERYGERPIQALAASIVPAAVGLAARAGDVDPETGEQISRPVESIWQAIQSRFPGQRETLPEGIDIQGQVITSGRPVASSLLPFKAQDATVDPVAQAMRNAEYYPQRPSGRFTLAGEQVELRAHELAQFRRDAGTAFSEFAKAALDNPTWFTLAPEAQRELLRLAHNRALDLAKARYIRRSQGAKVGDADTEARSQIVQQDSLRRSDPAAASAIDQLDRASAQRSPE